MLVNPFFAILLTNNLGNTDNVSSVKFDSDVI